MRPLGQNCFICGSPHPPPLLLALNAGTDAGRGVEAVVVDRSPGDVTVWKTDNGYVDGLKVGIGVVVRLVGGILVVLRIIIGKMVDEDFCVELVVVTNGNLEDVLRLLLAMLNPKLEDEFVLTDPPGK